MNVTALHLIGENSETVWIDENCPVLYQKGDAYQLYRKRTSRRCAVPDLYRIYTTTVAQLPEIYHMKPFWIQIQYESNTPAEINPVRIWYRHYDFGEVRFESVMTQKIRHNVEEIKKIRAAAKVGLYECVLRSCCCCCDAHVSIIVKSMHTSYETGMRVSAHTPTSSTNQYESPHILCSSHFLLVQHVTHVLSCWFNECTRPNTPRTRSQ